MVIILFCPSLMLGSLSSCGTLFSKDIMDGCMYEVGDFLCWGGMGVIVY